MHAAAYCAAFLGTVTHKANHHKVLLTKPNGFQGYTYCRDSAPGKRPSKASVAADQQTRMTEALLSAEEFVKGTKRGNGEVISPNASVVSHPPLEYVHEPCAKSFQSLQEARRKIARVNAELCEEQRFQASWRERRDKRPALAPSSGSAAKDRTEDLRQRIAAKNVAASA